MTRELTRIELQQWLGESPKGSDQEMMCTMALALLDLRVGIETTYDVLVRAQLHADQHAENARAAGFVAGLGAAIQEMQNLKRALLPQPTTEGASDA